MAYAFVKDVAASWELYQRIATPTVEPLPKGLLLHVAGPTDEGFRVINVWTSDHDWRRLQRERLAPAIAALGGPARPEPTFLELRAEHLLVGDVHNRDRERLLEPLRERT